MGESREEQGGTRVVYELNDLSVSNGGSKGRTPHQMHITLLVGYLTPDSDLDLAPDPDQFQLSCAQQMSAKQILKPGGGIHFMGGMAIKPSF